jgi:sugar lactone lactonase YvrE
VSRSLRPSVLVLVAAFLLTFVGIASALEPTVSTFATGMSFARGLAVDATGRLYCSQRNVGTIVRCTPPNNTMSPFASGISDPIDMVFDDAGNLFVVDFDNSGSNGHIYKITPAGTKTVFKSLSGYSCLTRDAAGNLYAGHDFFQKVLKITPAGDTSTYVPAIGDPNARLSMVHMDTDGSLYAGTMQGKIYKVAPGGSPVTTFCTGLTNVVGFDRGTGGNWFASTYAGDRIWQITPAGVATPYSGAEAVTALVNGPISVARFNHPTGLLFYQGEMYLADTQNNVIRAISSPVPTAKSSWGGVKRLYR